MADEKVSYEELLSEVCRLQDEGKLPVRLTREERISFVYGNVKLSNDNITREMVERAVDEKILAEAEGKELVDGDHYWIRGEYAPEPFVGQYKNTRHGGRWWVVGIEIPFRSDAFEVIARIEPPKVTP
jgi:hypothetical protein